MLRLSPGNAVLDVACGTWRNFPLIEARIGHSGRIVGVDIMPAMTNMARARVDRYSWGNVQLIEVDAAQVSLERLQAACAIQAGQRFDAAICMLGLSVIRGPARGRAP